MDTLMELNKHKISEFIRSNITLFNSFDNVYLFGSALDINKFPNDIDLLLIYSKYSDKIKNDLSVIRSVLEKENRLSVDLTVLSGEEEKDTNFINKLNQHYLKLK